MDKIQIIDWVVNQIAVQIHQKPQKEHIGAIFQQIFADKYPQDYIEHITEQWDGNFGNWYLEAGVEHASHLLRFFGIDVDPDPYPDFQDRHNAIHKGISGFDLFPAQYYLVKLFFLTTGNNHMRVLERIAPDAYRLTRFHELDMYGNTINWSIAWQMFSPQDKEKILDYILKVDEEENRQLKKSL